MTRLARPARDRFDEKTRTGLDGCVEWTGGKTSTGYGTFYVGPGRYALAHRYVYEQTVGPIPDGMNLDHLCRNRGCVNPAHVEPVTQRENLLRGLTIPAMNASKTKCPGGHDLSGSNLYVDPQGGRRCRTCRRSRNRLAKRAA